MTEYKVAREVVEAEFNALCENVDIDNDVANMSDEDQKGFEEQKAKLVRAIMRGALTFNDDGLPVYAPQRSDIPNALTFHEQTGAHLMAMDRKKDGQNVAKLLSLMDAMTKSAPGTCSKLNAADLKTCMAIITLFLA